MSVPSPRHVALLVPYRWRGPEPVFFLQVRDDRAPVYPGRIGLFGGHVEPGETAAVAVVREAGEELSVGGAPFALTGHRHVCHHVEDGVIRDIYVVPVDEMFAAEVRVHEGEGGVWLTPQELMREPRVVDVYQSLLPGFVER